MCTTYKLGISRLRLFFVGCFEGVGGKLPYKGGSLSHYSRDIYFIVFLVGRFDAWPINGASRKTSVEFGQSIADNSAARSV